MGKINNILKRIFNFFNSVFAALGCLLIVMLIKANINEIQLSDWGGPSIYLSWFIAISVLGISILGFCAAHFENSFALKAFAGFTGVGMIVTLVIGIVTAVNNNKIKPAFEEPETVKTLMQDKTITDTLKTLQSDDHCCGLVSAKDWGDVIPDSCACTDFGYGGYGQTEGSGCTSRPEGTTGPSQVYQKSCREFFLSAADLLFQIAMGLYFGFAVIALLCLLISIPMIRQVVRHNDAGGPQITMKGC